ncbi:MAG: HNH endonuclease [Pyrinomonadaceae bacterium]|nr:HNH endonuclease [Pyrinomonadaceae bacterium]
MSIRISKKVRREVFERAKNLCEYCFRSEDFTIYSHEIDHIIPRKHGGGNEFENLALSCWQCNGNKGTDFCSFDWETNGALTLFFNPRKQIWTNHFKLEKAEIVALTAEARVTTRILRFNDAERIEERRELIEAGIYE